MHAATKAQVYNHFGEYKVKIKMAYMQTDTMGITTVVHTEQRKKQSDVEALTQSEPDFDLVYSM